MAQAVVGMLVQVLLVALVAEVAVALARRWSSHLVVWVHQAKGMLAGIVRIVVLLMAALVAVEALEP